MIALFFFFFNDTATTEIYTLSLHDALPISRIEKQLGKYLESVKATGLISRYEIAAQVKGNGFKIVLDRKSTRLNSSHANISYAVFCLKKKKNKLIYSLILITNTL